MNMKHLAIYLDVINQFLAMDIGNPLVKDLVNKELNEWFKVTDGLINYYKELFPETVVTDMENRTELIYLLVKKGLSVPDEDIQNVIKILKDSSNDFYNYSTADKKSS